MNVSKKNRRGNQRGAIKHNADVVVRAYYAACGIWVYDTDIGKAIKRGTGFFVHEGGWIATAEHVISGIQTDNKPLKYLCIWRGGSGHLDILSGDPSTDVGLCHVKSNDPFPLRLEMCPDNYTTSLGSDIRFVGTMVEVVNTKGIPKYQFKYTPFVRAGIVSAIQNNKFMFTIDQPALPGDSGSAIIDLRSGYVIGIAVSVMLQKSIVKKEPTLLRQYTHAVNVLALRRLIWASQTDKKIPALFPHLKIRNSIQPS